MDNTAIQPGPPAATAPETAIQAAPPVDAKPRAEPKHPAYVLLERAASLMNEHDQEFKCFRCERNSLAIADEEPLARIELKAPEFVQMTDNTRHMCKKNFLRTFLAFPKDLAGGMDLGLAAGGTGRPSWDVIIVTARMESREVLLWLRCD